MTATDELRRLLNERGVEWMPIAWNPTRETFYHTQDGVGFCADEYADGVKIYTDVTVTPEQAIDATLGRGTCENVGYYIDSTRFKCSACGFNGWTKYAADGNDRVPNYCPNCGRKVVDA